MTTDEGAEAFLKQDLSDPNFLGFKPLNWEFPKNFARINMRLPVAPMQALKARAAVRDITCQRLIREVPERKVNAESELSKP